MRVKKTANENRQTGFSLIELMVVVAILGILASIALPSYQESIRQTRRGDATAVLMENAQFLERTFTQNTSYLVAGANPVLPNTESPKDGSAKYYDISLSGTNTASTYSLQAVPKGAMAGDACGTMTLNQAGVKGVSGGSKSVGQCWK
ncbi:MAG: type IV pilin protein [Betaproteobacteria bacterium]|nr:type IV pilin protein [Betaproteobacteria bacterium]MBP6187638.1 type IV pilin protein [Azonexus sp.]MBP6201509.1 type IV pilin protein [Azonexus sp.]